MLTIIHKIHVIHLYIKYLIWKYFRVSYHLIEDLHVHTNLCDKLQKQHVSDNNKDVQVYFYWCLSGSIFIVYITMNKQKKTVALDTVSLIHVFIHTENAYSFTNVPAHYINVLFPRQIFIIEYAYKICYMFPSDMYIFNKKVIQSLRR